MSGESSPSANTNNSDLSSVAFNYDKMNSTIKLILAKTKSQCSVEMLHSLNDGKTSFITISMELMMSYGI
jgi:hypothetical protein